ncbi:hypothetical protein FSP39_019179 [Pinctada imbricata]|uniref:Cytochrome P450 n=1 Tax=Pinctada imbricata TaxID=66713 RepID=A0AA88XGP9_PINIB|nr:hypothetical protein FSP39_019179 [Pinctada imbricata]
MMISTPRDDNHQECCLCTEEAGWGGFSNTYEKAEKEKILLMQTGAKMFATWLGPFNLLVAVCHPDTAKLLFKSSEPKPVFRPPSGYYFGKRWLGHDTTASAISWAAYYLGKYPEEQQKVYEEIKQTTKGEENFTWENINECRQLSLFLKESVRHSSPVPGIARFLTKPFKYNDIEIPAGRGIGILLLHVNNHPDVWTDPEVFKPERFIESEGKGRDPYAYVPFSAGPRFKISLVPDFEYIPEYQVVTRARNGIRLHMEERN